MIMIKIFVPLTALILSILSCGKCQDCDPISTSKYSLINNLNLDIELIFYGNSLVGYLTDTVYVKKNETITFMNFATGAPVKTLLSFEYSLCDSIHIKDVTGLLFSTKGLEDCQNIYNVLCTENYTLTKLDEVKSGRSKGDKYSEYELVIK